MEAGVDGIGENEGCEVVVDGCTRNMEGLCLQWWVRKGRGGEA